MRRPEQGEAGVVYVWNDDKCRAARGARAARQSPRGRRDLFPRQGIYNAGLQKTLRTGTHWGSHADAAPPEACQVPGDAGDTGMRTWKSRPQAPLSAPGQLPWLPVRAP